MGWTSTVFPALQAGNIIINQKGEFAYSPKPGAGNLVETVGIQATPGAPHDPYGNIYLPGSTTYNNPTGYAVQSFNGAINFYVGSLSIGWTLTGSVLGGPSPAANHAITISNTNALVFSTSRAFIFPSGDVTGAVDPQNINGALSHGYDVQLLNGTYYVNPSNPIHLTNGSIIKGAGRPPIGKSTGTIIKAVGAVNSILASDSWLTNTAGGNTGCNISDLKIDGNGTAITCLTLTTFDALCENVNFENATFQGVELDANTSNGSVGITADAPNNRFLHCVFSNCGQNGLRADDRGNIVFTDGIIDDCTFATMTGTTSASGPIAIDHAGGWDIHDCHLYGLSANGMKLGVMSAGTRVVNNYIESWGQGNVAGTYYGIDGVTNPVFGSEGPVIADNMFWLHTAPGNAGSTIYGIALATPANSTNYWMVKGNELACDPTTGFVAANGIAYINSAATSTTNAVIGNQVHGGWTNAVLQVPAGGVINLTTGV